MRRAAILPAIALAAAALLAVPLGPAPAQQKAAAARRDWSRTVVATPQGGFRMGNPNARVKLVEYGSLTCPHCAAFARDGKPRLIADHVRNGRVSFEFRHLMLNLPDAAATLLARCGGPSRFFPIADAIFAAQPQWWGRAAALTDAQFAEINALGPTAQVGRMAQLSGLAALAAQAGIPPQRQRACLSDQAALDRLTGMYNAAGRLGVDRTPTFFINGVRAPVNTWPALQPLIRSAGG